MTSCFFVSDLHGNIHRYEKLFECIAGEQPEAVFIGGDILPSGLYSFTSNPLLPEEFIHVFLANKLAKLRDNLKDDYPRIFVIMGNDDGKVYEPHLKELEGQGLIEYVHNKKIGFGNFSVYGYANVPPTPFMLKDWERYDVSWFVDPGCVPPEEGAFTVQVNKKHIPYLTIRKDLQELFGEDDLSRAIVLFHTPPYQTALDRAALDDKFFEHVPLDVHVGSIAVKEFIEARKPLITLHGHVHESTSLTGKWKIMIGATFAMNAAHNGPQLALIRFDADDCSSSTRELI